MATAAVGPRVDRYQTDAAEPDRATALTIELMCAQIARSASSPAVAAAVRDAVARFRGGLMFAATGRDASRDRRAIAESIWWWCKHALRFQHHEGLIRVWFGESDQLQLLISPDLLLTMERPRGDCAIFTALICSMLRACGIPYEIVTLAVDPRQPDVYSHVFPRAVLEDGRRLALDASHGKFAGWEVPREHQIRRQVWDESGVPIPDAAGRFRGLHGYVAHPRRPALPRLFTSLPGMAGYRGFGQVDAAAAPYYLAAPVSDATGYVPTDAIAYVPGSVPAPAPAFNLGQTIGNLLTQWTQIGSRVIAPTTTVSTGPGGTQITTPAGSPLPAGAAVAGAAGGGGLVLLLAAAVVIILAARGGKG